MANELAINANNTLANRDEMADGQVAHFFDTSKDEGKFALFDALQTEDKVDAHLGETMNLVNCVAQAVEVADANTGEVNRSLRVVLVGEDGSAWSATSPSLAKSLNTLFGIFGTPNTWGKPLPDKVIERKSRNGYKFFTLVPVR